MDEQNGYAALVDVLMNLALAAERGAEQDKATAFLELALAALEQAVEADPED
jgi:hypothetical protein